MATALACRVPSFSSPHTSRRTLRLSVGDPLERSLEFLDPHRVVLADAEILLDDLRVGLRLGIAGRAGRLVEGRACC